MEILYWSEKENQLAGGIFHCALSVSSVSDLFCSLFIWLSSAKEIHFYFGISTIFFKMVFFCLTSAKEFYFGVQCRISTIFVKWGIIICLISAEEIYVNVESPKKFPFFLNGILLSVWSQPKRFNLIVESPHFFF